MKKKYETPSVAKVEVLPPNGYFTPVCKGGDGKGTPHGNDGSCNG